MVISLPLPNLIFRFLISHCHHMKLLMIVGGCPSAEQESDLARAVGHEVDHPRVCTPRCPLAPPRSLSESPNRHGIQPGSWRTLFANLRPLYAPHR